MAFKRKYTPRNRSVKRKRSTPFRQRVPGNRTLRMSTVPMLRVKRKFWLQNWVPSTTTTADFWKRFSFSLSQVPNQAEYTALFDQYKISAVKLQFIPKFSAFDGANTTDVTLPGVTNQGPTYAHILNDPYSVVAPSGTYTSTNLNSFMELGNIRSLYGTRPFSIYVKPTIQGRADGVDTNMWQRSKYLPTTSTGISHFGPQVFLQDQNLTGTFGNSYDIFCTFYMTFKNAK